MIQTSAALAASAATRAQSCRVLCACSFGMLVAQALVCLSWKKKAVLGGMSSMTEKLLKLSLNGCSSKCCRKQLPLRRHLRKHGAGQGEVKGTRIDKLAG